MSTLYTNFIDGVLSAGISSADATVSASVFSALPVVSGGDVVWLTIDPDASAGAPEIVKVTAHSASATSVTVDRGQQGTTARSHLSGVRVTNAVTDADLSSFEVAPIETADIADGAVTTVKLAALAVTAAKLAEPSVTTAKITDASVTAAKLAADVFTYSAGDVKQSVRSVAEAGWLLMDGTAYAGADVSYPDLWAVAPASWKSGTTLTLPDMADRIVQGGGTLGATSGANSVTAVLPAHTHSTPNHTHGMTHGHADTFTANQSGHTHSFSGTTSSDTHSHDTTLHNNVGADGATGANASNSAVGGQVTTAPDTHSHTFSGTTGSTDPTITISGSVTNFSGNTASGGASTTGSTGSGTTMSVEQAALRLNFFIKT